MEAPSSVAWGGMGGDHTLAPGSLMRRCSWDLMAKPFLSVGASRGKYTTAGRGAGRHKRRDLEQILGLSHRGRRRRGWRRRRRRYIEMKEGRGRELDWASSSPLVPKLRKTRVVSGRDFHQRKGNRGREGTEASPLAASGHFIQGPHRCTSPGDTRRITEDRYDGERAGGGTIGRVLDGDMVAQGC